MTTLSFHSTTITPVVLDDHQIWLRLPQIGAALGYASPYKVQQLFERNSDEFTPAMTRLVELDTKGGKQAVRVFSLRGAHLLAMFARTPVAKEFRRWALDVLEQHTCAPQPITPPLALTLSGAEAMNLYALLHHLPHLQQAWRDLVPALRLLDSPLASRYHDRFAALACASTLPPLAAQLAQHLGRGLPHEPPAQTPDADRDPPRLRAYR